MCLILFAFNSHPTYRLVLAANRDEFYDRPSASMSFWNDHPNLLAGRDLKMKGTWMGITRSGRIAAITNYREPGNQKPDAPSRGHLISDFLIGKDPPGAYLERIRANGGQYNGFNLLAGDINTLYYYSNRDGKPLCLEPGIFGLSNRLLDTDWPKVRQGKSRLRSILNNNHDPWSGTVLDLLMTWKKPPDDQLPKTGVGIAWERTLSPIFITSPTYGTRCSTILTIDRSNHVKIAEYTWEPGRSGPVLAGKEVYDFIIQ